MIIWIPSCASFCITYITSYNFYRLQNVFGRKHLSDASLDRRLKNDIILDVESCKFKNLDEKGFFKTYAYVRKIVTQSTTPLPAK